MNGLSEFLIDLIFRQKSAVIPELGSFRFEVSPARMNFGENLIYPPSQQLVFSESTSDEGEVSFLDFLIKEKGFDEHEAEIRIKAYVHQLKEDLKSTGFAYISGLGTLSLMDNTTIQFTSGDKMKAMKPTMGLPELSVIPVAHEYTKEPEEAEVTTTTTFVESRPGKTNNNSWMIPLIGGFVLLGLGLIGYFLYQSQYAHPSDNPSEQIEVNQDSLLLANNNFVEQNEVKDSINDKSGIEEEIDQQNLTSEQAGSDYVPDDQMSNTSTTTSNSNNAQEKAEASSPEKSIKDGSPNKVCAVIVGVMANASNVKRLERTIKKAGYTPYSYVSKGLTRVGAACECNQVSIDATMADMQKINADAWLYESN